MRGNTGALGDLLKRDRLFVGTGAIPMMNLPIEGHNECVYFDRVADAEIYLSFYELLGLSVFLASRQPLLCRHNISTLYINFLCIRTKVY